MIIKQFLLFPNHQKRGQKRGKEKEICEGLISHRQKVGKKDGIQGNSLLGFSLLSFLINSLIRVT